MSHNPRLTEKTTTIHNVSVSHRGRQVIHDAFLRNESQITRPLYFAYDANGNLLQRTVPTPADHTYLYDDDGYLKTKTTPQGATTYSYGTLGELLTVTTPTTSTGSVTVISYQHNANNQRVAKLINGTVVEKYLWANLTTLLAIYDKDDNLVQRFEYADNRMPLSMTDVNGTKYYLHYDQVGSLRAVSRVLSPDNTFEVVKEITYDTYGNILSDSNPSFKVPFGFAGGLYDQDTKLTRFGYREYDAYTGKWTAKDPIGFAGGDSNLYGYVLGDPVDFMDPEGLIFEEVVITVGGIIGVGYAIGDYIKDLIKSDTLEEGWKKGFCNAYNKSKDCTAALLHMNSFCGTNVDCKDYSKSLFDKCPKLCECVK